MKRRAPLGRPESVLGETRAAGRGRIAVSQPGMAGAINHRPFGDDGQAVGPGHQRSSAIGSCNDAKVDDLALPSHPRR